MRCEVARMSNGKSKGWALMDFESLDQVEEGVKVLRDTELEGRHICVRMERKSVENSVKEGEQMDNPSSGVQVVVRNLPWTTTKDDLSAVFTKVGKVSAATVKCFSDSGRSKGGRLFVLKQKKRLKLRSKDSTVQTLEAEKSKFESIASNEAPPFFKNAL